MKETAKFNIIFNKIFNYIFIILLLLLCADSYRNPSKSQNIIGFSAYRLIIPFLLSQVILRWKYNFKFFSKLIKLLSFFIFPIITILSIIFNIISAFSPPNYIYTQTNIHLQQLGILSLFVGLSLLINKTNNWWQKNLNKVTFLFPFILFFVLIMVSFWPNDIFKIIILEDHFIENFQFYILFLGSILSLFFALKSFSKNKYIFFVFFLILLFVSGDEVSWGQRIFNVKTLDILSPYNLQNENTIHNLSFFDSFIKLSYLIFPWLCIFGGLLKKNRIIVNKFISSWIPNTNFLGYFLFPGIFHLTNLFPVNFSLKEWAEPTELFLYCGLVFWIAYRGLEDRTYGKNKYIRGAN